MKSLVKIAMLSLVFASVSAQADVLTNLGNVTVPSAVNYGQSFNSSATTSTFYDDYTFTITDSATNSVTSSITLGNFLGIGNLRARLYTGSDHITAPSSSFPSSSSVLLENWGNTMNLSSSVSSTTVVLDPVYLAAGTYTLQIKGTVTGEFGGSYAGLLNLGPVGALSIDPVPEPQTNAMLLAGVVVLGFMASKRKNNV